MLKEPILFINFKNYKEAVMQNAVSLAKTAESVAKKTGKEIVLVVNPVELSLIAKSVSIPVFSQHVDFEDLGKGNGKVLPEVAKYHGAKGTVLNHAEFKLSNEILQKSLARAKNNGLIVMVCAETVERARQIAAMTPRPDYIAVEPPELIGSDTLSVANANPEIISGTVKAVHAIAKIPVITGAGIKSTQDVRTAIELGTRGVFVASHIMRSPDKEKAICELAEGL